MIVTIGLVASANPAAADDCPANLVCAARPQSVADALLASGYKAQLGRNDKTGNPKVESGANGYKFTIYFYGCKAEKDCTSLGFATIFENDGTNTAELANLWNRDNRFSQMAANDDGSMAFTYDVTTVGGLTPANFADVVDWWQTMLGQVGKFFKEHPAK